MFHWTISLSDKQVMMLMAFFNAEDDQDGSRFNAVSHMIGNAWDVRSARNLHENGLVSVREDERRKSIWNITSKGELICLAMMEDADSLAMIAQNNGRQASHLIQADGHTRFIEKREASAKRICPKCKKPIGKHDKSTRGKNGYQHINCENPTEYK